MVDDGRRTDDGRTTEHGYTISSPCEPDGSGELKMVCKLHTKAEFLLFRLLSSCMYKTETKILIAATLLTKFYSISWQSVALSNKLKCKNTTSQYDI